MGMKITIKPEKYFPAAGVLTTKGVCMAVGPESFVTSNGTYPLAEWEPISMRFRYKEKDVFIVPAFAEQFLEREEIEEGEFKLMKAFDTYFVVDAKFAGYVTGHEVNE